MSISEPCRNKYANMLPPLKTQISEGDSDKKENHTGWWRCPTCGGYWRTTGRIEWEESEQEKENNVEISRDAEICDNCEGQLWESDGRHTREMRSPTVIYTEGGKRWVYVGKTRVPPPEFYGKTKRSFKIGMITTVDTSDGEDMYVYSTDAESPPRVERPRKKNQKRTWN